jgi:two-component system sensor histidine kinase/response regulator
MARILIVDDERGQRRAIARIFEGSDYVLEEAESGEEALRLAERELPDLVLLDLRMDGMGGLETARRLREIAGQEYLAIVVITAATDLPTRLSGLEIADEVMHKPFDGSELQRRVKHLLKLRSAWKCIQGEKTELVRQKGMQNEMAALLVHDLKNPLSAIIGNVAFALEELGPGQTDAREALDDTLVAARRLRRIIGNLLDVHHLESSKLQVFSTEVDLGTFLYELQRLHGRRVVSERIRLEVSAPPGAKLHGDIDLLHRMIENVLDNAFRYAKPDGLIKIEVRVRPEMLQIRIGNSGAPVPEVMRVRLFEKFAQGEMAPMNFGLGLYFCRLAAEAHGGTIRVESEPALPTVFVIDLPSKSS